MTHTRPIVATLLMMLTLLVTGCGTQEGETVFTAGPTNPDAGGKAPYSGTYTLTTAMSANPTLTVQVQEGQPLGFRKGEEGGSIVAYYNDQSYPLAKGTSQVYWKHQKK
jgi:hypothetical protein